MAFRRDQSCGAPRGSAMTYVQEWQRLSSAIKLLTAAGYRTRAARRDLCNLIADGKVRVRLTVAQGTSDIFGVFRGANIKVPDHLAPKDIDWKNSRPIKPWLIGPRNRVDERHFFSWRSRPIALI